MAVAGAEITNGFKPLFSGRDCNGLDVRFGFLGNDGWQIRRSGQTVAMGGAANQTAGLNQFLDLIRVTSVLFSTLAGAVGAPRRRIAEGADGRQRTEEQRAREPKGERGGESGRDHGPQHHGTRDGAVNSVFCLLSCAFSALGF